MYEDDRSGGVKMYFKKRFRKITSLTLTPGVSIFDERYRPSLYENIEGQGNRGGKIAENVEDIFQANAFLMADFVPDPKDLVSISVNVNKFVLRDENVVASLQKQRYQQPVNFSPRISASRQVVPNHFVFASISHGLSYPSISEILYPDGTINPGVRPEKAWSFEAGFKGIQLFKALKYSLAFYYMPVNDLIVPDRIAEDTYVGKNIGESLHTGVELSAEKAFPVSDKLSWFYFGDYRLTFNWQSNRFRDFYLDGRNLRGNELPGVPARRVFFLVNVRIRDLFFVEPELFVNGKTAMNDENTLYYGAYSIVNLRCGFSLQRRSWDLKISSSLNNLLDERYASMILINAPAANNRPPRYYYPGLPGNYFVGVSVERKF
jgi:iron complex outermembrane receptor protein